MSLTIEQVQHIASLARLELTEDELMRYRRQLSAILDYFQQLDGLNTENIPQIANVPIDQTPLRADQPIQGLALEELMHNAPENDDRLFRVPPVFE